MPICERDPWRDQYFRDIACPDDILIPTDDPDCWQWYPGHRWIYDKLRIALSQGLHCGPHGVAPETYPVFSKPVFNLKGMSIGGRLIRSAAELEHHYTPGHMWMDCLTGEHVSTDCAICDGAVVWSRQATGEAWNDGLFGTWTIHAEGDGSVDQYIAAWADRHMRGYFGMMNFETIGGRIIEAHLRFADQWCDLYGAGWIEAMIGLYRTGCWSYSETRRQDAYSLPLFAAHGRPYRHPAPEVQAEVRAMPDVSSLQIPFYEDKPPEDHPMPGGGFRVGIINCTDLAAGKRARRRLAAAFPEDSILWPPGDGPDQT